MRSLNDVLRLFAADPEIGPSARVELDLGCKVFRGTVYDALLFSPEVGFPADARVLGYSAAVLPRAYCAKGGPALTWVVHLDGGK